MLDLADAGRTLVVDYSAGMKKKIGLACALLHAPRLLVLDEPFEAVDPVSAALIRDILQRYVAGGGTVIFSSHVMEVVERLCTPRRDPRDGRDQGRRHAGRGRGGPDLEEVFVEVVGGRVGHRRGAVMAVAGAADAGRCRRRLRPAQAAPAAQLVARRRLAHRAVVLGMLGRAWFALVGFVVLRGQRRLLPSATATSSPCSAAPRSSLGWVLLPLLMFGVDETLDPARFALLPLPRRVLVRGHARGRLRRRSADRDRSSRRRAWCSARRAGASVPRRCRVRRYRARPAAVRVGEPGGDQRDRRHAAFPAGRGTWRPSSSRCSPRRRRRCSSRDVLGRSNGGPDAAVSVARVMAWTPLACAVRRGARRRPAGGLAAAARLAIRR